MVGENRFLGPELGLAKQKRGSWKMMREAPSSLRNRVTDLEGIEISKSFEQIKTGSEVILQ